MAIDYKVALRKAGIESRIKRVLKIHELSDGTLCMLAETKPNDPSGQPWAYVEFTPAPQSFEATFWETQEAAIAHAASEPKRMWSC